MLAAEVGIRGGVRFRIVQSLKRRDVNAWLIAWYTMDLCSLFSLSLECLPLSLCFVESESGHGAFKQYIHVAIGHLSLSFLRVGAEFERRNRCAYVF